CRGLPGFFHAGCAFRFFRLIEFTSRHGPQSPGSYIPMNILSTEEKGKLTAIPDSGFFAEMTIYKAAEKGKPLFRDAC
ncbi:MAG TPA: hypothetical protein VLS90_08345, partial [Thermodesulfobacteriota bacterium]|nr:hypothetical protein [Thermodesulfobacteriota bacterium]